MIVVHFFRWRSSVWTGLGVFPPASAIISVLVTPPVVPYIVAVAGGAWSSGTSGPPPLAALPFPEGPAAISHLTSLELSVYYGQLSDLLNPFWTCLFPGSDPRPHKLVEKVQSGIYVEMKELLEDNTSLLNELESLTVPTTINNTSY